MHPSKHPSIDTSDPNFQKWKRLHICLAKLESVTEMSSHMSFFAVLAAVDLKINPDTKNEPLIIAMVTVTSLLVSITMCVKFIATNILPSIQVVAEADGLKEVRRSPHEHLIYFINIAWIFANIICPCLFAIDLALLCWLQFELIAIEAAYAATGIMAVLLIVFLIFGITFLKQKIPYKRKRSQHLKEIVKLAQAITGIRDEGYYDILKRRSCSSTSYADNNESQSSSLTSSCEESDTYSSSSVSSGNETDVSGSHLTSSTYLESETDKTYLLRKQLTVKKANSYGSTAQSDRSKPGGLFNHTLYFYSSN